MLHCFLFHTLCDNLTSLFISKVYCFFNDCVYVLYLHHKTIKNSLFFLYAFLLIHDDKILLLQIACTAIHRLNINRQSMILTDADK